MVILIIGTFASQFDRLISVIKSCELLGKKVVLEGRSIKTHIDIALTAKMLEVDSKVFIDATHIGDYSRQSGRTLDRCSR